MTDISWGVHNYGLAVEHATELPLVGDPFYIDVEYTEGDTPEFVLACVFTPGDTAVRVLRGDAGRDALKKASLARGVCGHNVKSDVRFLFNDDLSDGAPRIHDDSMILAYSHSSVLASFGLKELSKELLGLTWPSYRDIVGKGKGKQTLEKQPLELVSNYCAMDVYATAKLTEKLKSLISPVHMGIYQMIELPTYNALLQMETTGVRVDASYLAGLSKGWEAELEELKTTLKGQFGEAFNPLSPKQVTTVLSSVVGQKLEGSDRKILKEFEKTHEPVRQILRARGVSKLRSTYAEALIRRAPIVKCTFNQVVNDEHGTGASDGIDTTRLSSSDPNLQNIPKRTEEGKRIRAAFIPRDGFTFLVADYSQIEYRLLAHESKDPVLLDAYRNGEDLHKRTASIVLGKALEDVTDAERDIAKTINFAVIYGAQAKKIAFLTGKSEAECRRFLDVYFDRLPLVRSFIQMTKVKAHLSGATSTLFGRVIKLHGIHSRDRFEVYAAERKAVNYKIQGSAAEIMKMALINLTDAGLRVLLTVHDEFVIEVPFGEEDATVSTVRSLMCDGINLAVPLEVSIGLGDSWAKAKV